MQSFVRKSARAAIVAGVLLMLLSPLPIVCVQGFGDSHVGTMHELLWARKIATGLIVCGSILAAGGAITAYLLDRRPPAR